MISFILLFLRYSIGNLLIWPLIILSPKVRERIQFEKKYAPKGRIGSDIWFHVSSEGEWEQIWPLIQFFCQDESHELKGNITIWFTSPSLVNKVDKMKAMCEVYPQVSVYALSLLGINPFSARSILSHRPPKLFFMVRYDFFPELMSMGLRSEKFILLSGTLKNKWDSLKKNMVKTIVAKNRYGYFDQIIAATDFDRDSFNELLGEKSISCPESYDFRHIQIIERQRSLINLEESHFKDSIELLLEKFPKQRRIILGNFWFHEKELFTEDLLQAIKDNEILVFIAPHHLSGQDFDQIDEWFRDLENKGMNTVRWDKIGIHGEGNFILCSFPGLLCELYTYFGHCYIGNGFGRSIHSMLEPFWGGGNLYCGPKIHRSTEYDFAKAYYEKKNPNIPYVINDLQDLYSTILENDYSPESKDELLRSAEVIQSKGMALLDGFLTDYQALLATDQG